MTFNKYTTKQKGFTLVEIIVAVGIFSLVMLVAIGAVLAVVGANKKAQSLHNVINNFNLAVETMVRDMRTGYNYECEGLASDCTDGTGGQRITFVSSQSNGQDVTYEYVGDDTNGKITKRVGSGPSTDITSEDVVVTRLSFYVSGVESAEEGEYMQPIVLVVITGEARLHGKVSEFNIQTWVSQRRIDL